MYKLKKDLQVSLDGCAITTIPAGEYETLPKIAVAFATATDAFEGKTKGKEVENKDWSLPKSEPSE